MNKILKQDCVSGVCVGEATGVREGVSPSWHTHTGGTVRGEAPRAVAPALRRRFELLRALRPPALKAGAVIRAWLPQHMRFPMRFPISKKYFKIFIPQIIKTSMLS